MKIGAWPCIGCDSEPGDGGPPSDPRLDATEAYCPSPLWRGRCRGGRIVINPEHDDFPAVLAEAIDVMLACGDDPKPAAQALGCSTSQLIKLLKDSPRALGLLNERRRKAGRHPLR